ncbi:MAG: ABC transporter substrate-binding protein [Candidatus Aminicenantes bacterium]|nr:MAG: ABC transporter substrate-binding protein [Candidatus Aminicenantes bacterium]
MTFKKIGAVLLLVVLNISALIAQEKIIRDDLGFPYDATVPPQRIISLAPNITEILFALDLGGKVVGVTRYCDFPEDAANKEKIGGMIDPNPEKIIALNPDLIIGFRGNPLRIFERLRNLDLPVFVLDTGTTIDSIFPLIKKIGTVTHEEHKAALFVRSLRARYEKILSSLQNARHEPKVFLSLHGVGLWTCGQESFLNDLIKKARGVNIAGHVPRKWLLYNQEQLIHENPEVIVILSKSKKDFLTAKNWMKNEAHLEGTQAVTSDSIFFLDENLASRQGPRLIQALEELSHLLHPQCFVEGS